jgi:hypothetical protein
LAQSARDEGFPLSSQILRETAGKLRAALIMFEAGRQAPNLKRSPIGKPPQAPETSGTKPSVALPRRKLQAPEHGERSPERVLLNGPSECADIAANGAVEPTTDA